MTGHEIPDTISPPKSRFSSPRRVYPPRQLARVGGASPRATRSANVARVRTPHARARDARRVERALGTRITGTRAHIVTPLDRPSVSTRYTLRRARTRVRSRDAMSSDASSIGRVLSIPSTPRSNNGRDNANDDLILREGEELGECVDPRRRRAGPPKRCEMEERASCTLETMKTCQRARVVG